jgi:hypothetical protein
MQGQLEIVVGVSGNLDGKFFEVCSRVDMVLGIKPSLL